MEIKKSDAISTAGVKKRIAPTLNLCLMSSQAFRSYANMKKANGESLVGRVSYNIRNNIDQFTQMFKTYEDVRKEILTKYNLIDPSGTRLVEKTELNQRNWEDADREIGDVLQEKKEVEITAYHVECFLDYQISAADLGLLINIGLILEDKDCVEDEEKK